MSDELKKKVKMNHIGAFYSTRNSANGMLKEILGQKFSLIYSDTAFCEVNIFSGNCGKCCSIRHWKLPENEMQEMQEIFGRMENAHSV